MALIETRLRRRWSDLIRPGFNPDVRYVEHCTACGARFPVTPVGVEVTTPTAEPEAPAPLFASSAEPAAPPTAKSNPAADDLLPAIKRPSIVTPLRRAGGEQRQAALFSDDDEVTERS